MNKTAPVVKIGGIVSIIGTAILLSFAILLLAYPVEKKCFAESSNCYYFSRAPQPINSFISSYFLIISLSLITVGIGIFRFGSWFHERKASKEKNRNS